MIVIPKGRARLLIGVNCTLHLPGLDPVLRVAVIARGNMPAMQVDSGPYVGNILTSAVQGMVYQKAMAQRQSVQPVYSDLAAAPGFNGRPGRAPFKSPHDRRWKITVQLLLELRDPDSVM